MSEAEEIAWTLAAECRRAVLWQDRDALRVYIRMRLIDASPQMVDNVLEALYGLMTEAE
jgi:hypothetical protein